MIAFLAPSPKVSKPEVGVDKFVNFKQRVMRINWIMCIFPNFTTSMKKWKNAALGKEEQTVYTLHWRKWVSVWRINKNSKLFQRHPHRTAFKQKGNLEIKFVTSRQVLTCTWVIGSDLIRQEEKWLFFDHVSDIVLL